MTGIFGGAQSVPVTQQTFQQGTQNTSQNQTQAVGTAETGATQQTIDPNIYAKVGAQNLSDSTIAFKQPGAVPLQGIAPLNEGQNNAIGGIEQTGNAFGQNLPFLGASYLQSGADRMADAGNPLTGEEVAGFYNPMADNVTSQMMNIFGQQNLNNRMGMTAKTGGVGADRAAVGQALLANQQGLAAGQTYAGLYQQALTAAQQQKAQQMGAGQGLAALGLPTMGAGLQGYGSALTAATVPQQLQQAQLSAQYAQQQGQYEDPYRRTQALTNSIPGMVAGAGQTATQTSAVQRDALMNSQGTSAANTSQSGTGSGQTTYPAPSVLGQVAGLGSIAAGVGGLFSSSDERSKTDIEKVGKDPDTGLMNYAFRYKEDPKTYPKVVGPMAQDVKKKYPDAVKEFAYGGDVSDDQSYNNGTGSDSDLPTDDAVPLHDDAEKSAKDQAQNFQKKILAVNKLLQGVDKKMQRNLPTPAPIRFPQLQFRPPPNNTNNTGYAEGGSVPLPRARGVYEGEHDPTGGTRTTGQKPNGKNLPIRGVEPPAEPKAGTIKYDFRGTRRINDSLNQRPGAEPGVYARGGAADGGRVDDKPFVQGFAAGGAFGNGGGGAANGGVPGWGVGAEYFEGHDPAYWDAPAYPGGAPGAAAAARAAAWTQPSFQTTPYTADLADIQTAPAVAYPSVTGQATDLPNPAPSPLPGPTTPAPQGGGAGTVRDPNLWRAPGGWYPPANRGGGSAPNSGAGVNPNSQAGNYFHSQPGGSLPNWQNAAGRAVPRADGGGIYGYDPDPEGVAPVPVVDYQRRGRPELGGAELDRAAGMGVTARGGSNNSIWDAMKQHPDNAVNLARSRIKQIEYDRRLRGREPGEPYPPHGELQALRSYLRSLESGPATRAAGGPVGLPGLPMDEQENGGPEETGLPDQESMQIEHEPAGTPQQAGYGDYAEPPAAAASGLEGSQKPSGPQSGSAPGGGGMGNPASMALIQAGLGMLAASGQRDSRGLPMSPLGAIGKGGAMGVENYQEQKQQAFKNQTAMEATRLAQARAAETARHNKMLEQYVYGAPKSDAPPAVNEGAEAQRESGSMEPPDPKPVGNYSSEAIKLAGEQYFRTGKLPAGLSRDKEFRGATMSYAGELAKSRGASLKETTEMWLYAPKQAGWITGADGRQAGALGTVIDHLDTMKDLTAALKNGDNQTYNAIKNKVAKWSGKDYPTNVEAGAHIVGAEVMKAIGVAGAGSEAERNIQAMNLGDLSKSPQQFEGAINVAQRLAAGQLRTKIRQAEGLGLPEGRLQKLVGERAYKILNNLDAQQPDKSVLPDVGGGPAKGARKMFDDGKGGKVEGVWDGAKWGPVQ